MGIDVFLGKLVRGEPLFRLHYARLLPEESAVAEARKKISRKLTGTERKSATRCGLAF